MNATYRVQWAIDLDAQSPEDAARKALAVQRDPESIATSFEVREWMTDDWVDVDLIT